MNAMYYYFLLQLIFLDNVTFHFNRNKQKLKQLDFGLKFNSITRNEYWPYNCIFEDKPTNVDKSVEPPLIFFKPEKFSEFRVWSQRK